MPNFITKFFINEFLSNFKVTEHELELGDLVLPLGIPFVARDELGQSVEGEWCGDTTISIVPQGFQVIQVFNNKPTSLWLNILALFPRTRLFPDSLPWFVDNAWILIWWLHLEGSIPLGALQALSCIILTNFAPSWNPFVEKHPN